MRRCMFVPGKKCYVRGRSVPLEVCRTCIEAHKVFGGGDEDEKPVRWVGVALLRRTFSGVKVARQIPEEARVFNGYEKAIFNFLCSLKSLDGASIEVNEAKIRGIARRGGEVVVLMTNVDAHLEILEDEIEKAAETLKSERDWSKALEKAYREISLSAAS